MRQILLIIAIAFNCTAANWYADAWIYRRAIVLPATSDTIRDGSVLIAKGLPASFFAKSKTNGSDIIVTDADGITKLKRTIIKISASDSMIYMRARVPNRKASRTIYLYYGNSAGAEAITDTGAIPPAYRIAQPMVKSGVWNGLTRYTDNATMSGTMSSARQGVWGDSCLFGGTDANNYLSIAANQYNSGLTVHSIRLWFKYYPGLWNDYSFVNKISGALYSQGSSEMQFLSLGSGNNARVFYVDSTTGQFYFRYWNIPTHRNIEDQNWHQVTITYKDTAGATGTAVYIDNIRSDSLTAASGSFVGIRATSAPWHIGYSATSGYTFPGYMQEFQLVAATMSEAERTDAYLNEVDGGNGWYAIGNEESIPVVVSGTRYYRTVVFAANKIAENGTYVGWVDLSSMGDTWWNSCSLSTNIIVTNVNNDTASCLKYIPQFDKTSKTGIIFFKLAATTASGGTVRIQTGKSVRVFNNSKVFTDCGLYARYGMDDSSGTIVDGCGTYNTTNTGADYLATGIIGNGLTFVKANSDRIANASAMNFEYTQPFTIAMWIKRAAIEQATVLGRTDINGKGIWFWFNSGTGSFSLANQYGTYDVLTQFSNSSTDWQQVVVSYSGSGTAAGVNIYTNGALTSNSVIRDGLGSRSILLSNQCVIGGRDAIDLFYGGLMDEIRIYNTEKSANYITTDFNLQNHKSVAVYSLTDSGAVNDGVVKKSKNYDPFGFGFDYSEK